ncbi:PucR family transcriptional regulator [Pseudoneobacillus sp. C159]
MLEKLYSLYPNAITSTEKPDDYFGNYHWFTDSEQNHWVGIPKNDLLENQFILLCSLFNYYKTGHTTIFSNEMAKHWYSFLFGNGPIPPSKITDEYRLIYFQWINTEISQLDFEAALQAFFSTNITVIWENTRKGIIIEPKNKLSLTETDFISMNETLKVDFFVDPYFYIGKFRPVTHELLKVVQKEMALFHFAITSSKKEKLYYFEKVTPYFIINYLPNPLRLMMEKEILPVFKDDPELFSTIKEFLQNNMNASLTAKNLFIHRNTLQYRLDKFTDKTGIPLKEFYSTITVYLACILFEQER